MTVTAPTLSLSRLALASLPERELRDAVARFGNGEPLHSHRPSTSKE